MTVDRGGLRYVIRVDYQGQGPLRSFVSDVRKARAAWSGLNKDLKDTATTKAAREMERLGRETQRAAEQTRRSEQVQRRQARTLTITQEAFKRIVREQRKAAVEQARASISAQRNFQAQRQLIGATVARARAEERITRVLNRRRQRQAELIALQARGLSQDRAIRRELGLLTSRERRLERVQKARRSTIDALREANSLANSERLLQLRAQLVAQRRLNQARIQELSDAQLAAAGRPDLQSPAGRRRTAGAAVELEPSQAQRASQAFAQLGKNLGIANNQANRIGFTFRRLFGILAAFTIARVVVIGGFVTLVRTLISANAEIEKIELGIRSVLAAVGEVRNANGELVRGAEALAVASGEARRQSNLLRRDAILTTASFEQLAEAFQVGLGPGLAAGLSVDQVRIFARQISLAAQAIGLDQRQLAEEIRSILSGTIRISQTRIAAVLGLRNEDIRSARETGKLFDFLQDKFLEFELAGEQASLTLTGIVSNLNDAFRLLAAQGGIEFFRSLKDTLLELQTTIVNFDDTTGSTLIQPELLSSVRLIGAAFGQVVQDIRNLGRDSGLTGVQTLAEAIAVSFVTVSRALTGIIAGLVRVFSIANLIFRGIAGVAKSIAGFFGFDFNAFQKLFETVGVLLGFIIAIQTAMFVINGALKSVLLLSTAIRGIYIAMLLTVRNIRLAMAGVAIAAQASAGPIGLILALILAIGLAVGAFDGIISFVERGITRISGNLLRNLDRNIRRTLDNAEEDTEGTITAALQGLEKVQEAIGEVRNGLRTLRVSTRNALSVVVQGTALGADFNADNEIARLLAGFSEVETTTIGAIESLNDEVERLRGSLEGAADEQDRLNRLFQDEVFLFPDTVDPTFDRLVRIREALDVLRQIQDLERRAGPDSFLNPDQQGGLPGGGAANSLARQQAQRELDALQGRAIGLEISLAVEGVVFEEGALEDLERELAAAVGNEEEYLQRQEAIRQSLIRRAELNDESLRLTGESLSTEQRIAEILAEQKRLRDEIIDRQTQEAILSLRRLNVELRQKQLLRDGTLQDNSALSLVEFSQRAAFARITRNEEELSRLEAQRRLTILRAETAIAVQNIDTDLERLNRLREGNAARLTELELLRQQNGESDDLNARIEDAKRLQQEVTEQIRQQNDLRNATVAEAGFQAFELEFEASLDAVRSSGSVFEQFQVAAFDAFAELPNRFQFVLDTMQTAVQGFSNFVAQSISDAFDPNSNASVQERFGQFLQQLGRQIIATLVQVAVQAAILNALSGGILSTIFGNVGQAAIGSSGFFGGIGFNEGGRADRGRRRHARVHPAHMRAQGLATGGVPGRPRGLHPSDTIPAWLAQNEWVIRAKSAAKAGHDAMSRINAGDFDPGTLRSALGLRGQPKVSVAAAASGLGLASGDRVRAGASTATAMGTSGGGSTGAPSVAIIAPTRESVERLFAGGETLDALVEIVGDNQGLFNQALGRR